ncbi:MAG: phage tail assembly chaperone [Pseudomonadota bacterium]
MLPWDQMLRAALRCGVSVESFWTMSLLEWRWLAASNGDDALRGAELTGLMQAFPDTGENNG